MPATRPHALFTPLKVGAFELAHRVVMPALLRHRADPPHGVPNESMSRYYAQRATQGGLVVTETAWTHARGHTDGREPGLYSPEQVNAWRAVTRAVRARGAIAVAQLGDPASATSHLPQDIDTTLRHVRDAAECAGDAGFDGVEFLATLPERLFHDRQPGRPDEYGGALSNRIRLLLDLVHTLGGVWPMERVGLRLSALSGLTRARDPEGVETLAAAVSAAFRAGVAYVHIGSPWPAGGTFESADVVATLAALRGSGRLADGTLIASGGFDAASAERLLNAGHADAVAFGRAFITNPDLPWRLHCGAPLAPWPEDGVTDNLDHPVSDLHPANVRPPATTPGALRCDADPWHRGLR